MAKLFKRHLLEQIRPWLQTHEVIVILGARQVGKTSLLRLLQQELKDDPTFYFDLEDTFTLSRCQDVNRFLDYLKLNGLDESRKTFCFLDEIQYHPDPSKFLKLLHDHHPYLKLIVTGSSSFEIRRKFRDSLAGRRITFQLHTLSFAEYLEFLESEYAALRAGLDWLQASHQPEDFKRAHILTPTLLPLFERFLIYGGYPGIVTHPDRTLQQDRLREIYNTYVQRDIKDLGRIRDPLRFSKLVTFLAVQAGNLFKLDETAREVGLDQRTLSNHLFLLEHTFIITQLRPFATNLQKEITRMPKIFFLDNGLRNTMIADFRPLDLRLDTGLLAESAALGAFLKSNGRFVKFNYWRSTQAKELDFILTREGRRTIPVEVKYRVNLKPEIPPALRYFLKKWPAEQAFVFTKDTLHWADFQGTRVTFLPLWMV